MDILELYENKFVSDVSIRIGAFLEEEIKKPDVQKRIFKKLDAKLSLKIRASFPKKDLFVGDTFTLMNEIMSKLELLNYCVAFLNSYPKNQLWEKTFGRSDYVKYHLETYYGNVTGIFDRCLLLINFIFSLGIQDKDVKYNLIVSNDNLRGYKIKTALENFYKSISKVKQVRNRLDHRTRYSDDELDEIAVFDSVFRKGGLSTKLKRDLELPLKLAYASYLKKQKKGIKENNKNMIKLCDYFFDALFDKWSERLDSF